MSLIASVYAVTEEQLIALNQLAAQKKGDGMWEYLEEQKTEIVPEYGYDGEIISVLIAFLEEHDIEFPKFRKYENLKRIDIVPADAAPALAASIEELDQEVEDEDLTTFYTESTDEEFDDAEQAMREGLTFLVRGLRTAAKKKAYFVLNIAEGS